VACFLHWSQSSSIYNVFLLCLHFQEQPQVLQQSTLSMWGREERTELTNCTFPACMSIEDIDVDCLSTLFIKEAKCSIFGFVVPIGRPRYVKGIPWMLHPITPAKSSAFCGLMFRGTRKDFTKLINSETSRSSKSFQ
jgi:hypothetical protein